MDTFSRVSTNNLTIVDSRGLNFEVQIELPNHDNCLADYQANVTSFLEEGAEADPPLSLLDIHSRETTGVPTETLSPRQRPQYYRICVIGRVAAKTFHKGKWRREVDIMRELSHKHIVKFIELTTEVIPELILEYYPLGNLKDQHKSMPFDTDEVLLILLQGLDALKYIHEKGFAHRDIKPENILVESREPFSIRIADFGLSKDTSEQLVTLAGTHYYAAPEIYRQRRDYTQAVDIWSLGMVIYRTRLSAEDCYQAAIDTFFDGSIAEQDEANATSIDVAVLRHDEPANDGAVSDRNVESQINDNQAKSHVPSIEASESKAVEPVEDVAAPNEATDPPIKYGKSIKRRRLTSLPVETDAEEVSDAESDRTIRPRKVPEKGTTI
ncbi:MAG: hypothetical protein Q9167_007588 [Letrouitia subvulpina]